ncbi:N-acetylglucosamine-6-phosphate deacetylase [Carbonactinospora thermoautotrophica]|uniref:N-acetylglucosamine-6-phosphate deacetylase n=2 Tax=Carbonactinospora thermoautotrophica TaxID=1469144 RepID=A0A132MYL0_9ACTN|nr:N-acetylglucosamine-6-phosphate deacetylase [Carbonactinospora thermoautotrophica]KWX02988.1 N-acetylglucosamine-6-phosphate deacetylase [Carbonactinospora thermoautotrophica]
MTVLRHARLVLPGGVVEDGWLEVRSGRIAAVGAAGDAPLPRDALDLRGHWVVPGFVDIHVHGGGGASYTTGDPEEARAAAEFHRGHGTTTTVASLVTATVADLERSVAALTDLVEDGLLAGLHLEGPYLSRARCGAHDPNLLRAPDTGEVARLLDAARGTIRMVTIAPELPGGLDVIRQLADAGVLAAIGHTDATYAQTRAAIEAGATVATHLFNGMRGMHHREPGPVIAAMADAGVTVEVINDGGHLHPAVIGVVFDAVGADRVALITDAVSAAGMPDGVYRLGPVSVRVAGGVVRLVDGGSLAGSTLTMAGAFRRTVREVGVPIEQASRAASLTPARLLGLDGRIGSIEEGKDADLVVLDDDLEVVAVMRRGEWVREFARA